MGKMRNVIIWRMLPVILVTSVAAFWFNDVQQGGPFILRNLVPLALLVLLSWLTLYRGRGRWFGGDRRMPFGLIGYAMPALGLSLYLHYAYSINLNEMFTDVRHPDRIFQYLPIYTIVAGGIGFAIGRIVGRNV